MKGADYIIPHSKPTPKKNKKSKKSKYKKKTNRKPYTSRKKRMAKSAAAMARRPLQRVFAKYFKGFSLACAMLTDKRKWHHYAMSVIIATAVVGFCASPGSMRQLTEELLTEQAIANVYSLLGMPSLGQVPHWDTIINVLKSLPPIELEFLKMGLAKAVMIKHRAKLARFEGKALLMVDGQRLHEINEASAQEWMLWAAHNKGTPDEHVGYYTYFVCASILVAGYPVPVCTRMCANEGEPGAKQDCETKAAMDLVWAIKCAFPDTKFCVACDSLYVSAPFIRLLEELGYSYIITYKEGSASSIARELEEGRCGIGRLAVDEPGRPAPTEYVYANGIGYKGLELGYVRMVRVLTDQELAERKSKNASQEDGDILGLQCFAYITNIGIGPHNAQAAVEAGRSRWRGIEEMFNSEQAYFGARHMYSYDGSACWNIYGLLQIARLVTVLECLEEAELAALKGLLAFRKLCAKDFSTIFIGQGAVVGGNGLEQPPPQQAA